MFFPHVIGVLEEKQIENEGKKKKKVIANNFPNLMKNINLLIQDIQQTAKKDKHKDCQPVANC